MCVTGKIDRPWQAHQPNVVLDDGRIVFGMSEEVGSGELLTPLLQVQRNVLLPNCFVLCPIAVPYCCALLLGLSGTISLCKCLLRL